MANKKKTTSYAARSGGKTTPIGKSGSSSKSSSKSATKSSSHSSAGYRRPSGGKKNGKLNWAFIVAGAILLSTYLIVVVFNGFDWPGWDDGVSDLKDSASGVVSSVESAWSEVKDAHGSSPEDLVLDTPGGSVSGEVRVHFIDVGQGDCMLIEGNGESVLIDAGENDKGDEVLAYLAGVKIEKIDLAFGTHPHSDHIGGMDTVIEGIPVGKLLMPDVPDSIVPTTRTFLSMLDAADAQRTETLFAYPGDSFSVCGGTLSVLGPVEDYKDLNNESLVMRFDFGKTSFLFTGDQESDAEEDLMASGVDVSADVLKIGHHGSSTSTCQDFFDAVSPSIAVIECGEGNDYGHPHRETRQLLDKAGIDVYRTDLNGSIVITSDGEALTVQTEKAG